MSGIVPPMADAAAFFDLDRTLLAGASGPVIGRALREAGLLTRTVPGQATIFKIFDIVGENLPSMLLARRAVGMARGHSRQRAVDAAAAAGTVLAGMLQPFAAQLLADHRAAGRRLVLATTTPYDLVRPFADEVGFDDVVATRYTVDDDGNYDGTLDGPFVWSVGKLNAVKTWAAHACVDLAESWFYSDSIYDTPLLSAVGHPVVVNPDPRLVVMAAARRWPTMHLDVPPGVPKLPIVGLEPQQVALALWRPELLPFARWDIDGLEHVPAAGPALLVANHRSYFDATAVAIIAGRTGRAVRFLGKKEVFDAPVVGHIARAMGGIRVDRGTGSDEPLKAATDADAHGGRIEHVGQGTIPRGPAFFEPQLRGRWGAARLAALTRAPVVPVGLWGTERVWPRSARLPDLANVLDPPTVRIRVGAPVTLGYRSLAKDTERIMAAIAALLPAAARQHHEPTAAELARTYPPGHKGGARREAERRPGTD
jgi:putative phosphoserine phosphatase / 1-acylglycerol-3-phosphate O-acyltransferase